METDLWVIEFRTNPPTTEWVTVSETWFTKIGFRPMTPRSLEECSEMAVDKRHIWPTYEEGSMRLRNVESNEIVPFEIFT